MGVGGAGLNAPPPVSVPRFGYTPKVPPKERKPQEHRDKDNRSESRQTAAVAPPRVDINVRDQQQLKLERCKSEEATPVKLDSTQSRRPSAITVPPPSAAANAPRSSGSSTSRAYSPPLPPPNQQHQPYYNQNQHQSQHQQQLTQSQQPQQSKQQHHPPSGPRGVPPPTGPRVNSNVAPPSGPRAGSVFERDRERTETRPRDTSKWTVPPTKEKDEMAQQQAANISPGTNIIHPDRLKGIETVAEPLRDREIYSSHSHPMVIRTEHKHEEHEQQRPTGLVSFSVSATGDGDVSYDTSSASNNNSVVAGVSSLQWNASQRPSTQLSAVSSQKAMPPQSNRPGSSSDRQQHSLREILNPEGVGSGGGYTFGSIPTPSTNISTNNNTLNTNPNTNSTTAAASSTTTNSSSAALANPFFSYPQRASPQAANVPASSAPPSNTVIISASSPPRAPSASSSPQMTVKQVPTGPRAQMAGHPYGHGHPHPHMTGRANHWSTRGGAFGRGRGGEIASGMVMKREADDDVNAPVMGQGGRGGRVGGDWISSGRGRGAFDGARPGAPGTRRESRFGSVDGMESNSTPGSLGGIAGALREILSFEESHLFTLHNLNLKEDEVECKTVIGSGGFAQVFVQNLCIGNSQEKKPYAIKRISKDNHVFPRERYEREIKIFSSLAAQEAQVSVNFHPTSYFPLFP